MAMKDGARLANAISVAACDCGCGLIYIQLHDADGSVFARGGLKHDNAPAFAGNLIDAATDMAEGTVGMRSSFSAGHA